MNDQFKVGTICIGQNLNPKSKYNGVECEIIAGLEMRETINAHTNAKDYSPRYEVRFVDGCVRCLKPNQLRRKPPKQSDSQWADEAIRKLKKQSSDHVVIGKPELIPEESVQ